MSDGITDGDRETAKDREYKKRQICNFLNKHNECYLRNYNPCSGTGNCLLYSTWEMLIEFIKP